MKRFEQDDLLPRRWIPSRKVVLSSLALVLLACGCQSWHPSSSLTPGLSSLQGFQTKAERKVQRQASRDPFPSPSDVGLQSQR